MKTTLLALALTVLATACSTADRAQQKIADESVKPIVACAPYLALKPVGDTDPAPSQGGEVCARK